MAVQLTDFTFIPPNGGFFVHNEVLAGLNQKQWKADVSRLPGLLTNIKVLAVERGDCIRLDSAQQDA
jgi:hypothetical protein